MKIPLFQVDAFSDRLFSGNPAAVCPLQEWLADDTLQSIAAENNLSETAFFVRSGDSFELRWFTPAIEVDLCGHATLATAFIIWTKFDCPDRSLRFQTKRGELTVTRSSDRYSLDFPSRPPAECTVDPILVQALGGEPQTILLRNLNSRMGRGQGDDEP